MGEIMFQVADVESLIKTRRSLLVASITTLIFANLNFSTDKISFLGVEILMSQDTIVRLGQAGTLYFLVVFLLQAAPEFVKMFGWLWDTRIDSLERKAWNNFREEWNLDDDGYQEPIGGPEEDSDVIKWRFEQLRNRKSSWIGMLSVSTVLLANFFVAYLSPIIAALTCLLWPMAFATLVA
jgi:hypothetical protein